ncbi:MAG: GIY-YIG nuclease family protein [Cyanobacteria bacterium P01_H01_bin.15]
MSPKQLQLFQTPQRSWQSQPPSLTLSPEALQTWKRRVVGFQRQICQTLPVQQTSLLAEPDPWGNPDALNPFSLPVHASLFWRLVEPPKDMDLAQGCLYFIIDTAASLVLYIGETKLTPSKRWKGVHDAKSYIFNYIELHRSYGLDVCVNAAFYDRLPADKKVLRHWERELIYRWRSPFNQECWQYWGQPFGK